MEPECSLPHLQVPILSQFDPFYTPHIPLPEDPSSIVIKFYIIREIWQKFIFKLGFNFFYKINTLRWSVWAESVVSEEIIINKECFIRNK
jgi:hypothetical protein